MLKIILSCFIALSAFCPYALCEEESSKIICHRGLSAYEPENTIPAFMACTAAGIYGVECDIHETLDGEFAVIHDGEVDRMTDGTGSISTMTWEQVKKLNIDKGSGINKYKSLKIPSLREYIKICRNNHKVPVIEVKSIKKSSIKKFIEILKEEQIYNRAVLISSDKNFLCYVREKNPEVKIMWLCEMTIENINEAAKYKFDIDVEAAAFNPQLLSYAHNRNVKVNIWTIDNEEKFNKLKRTGVDYITTNKFIK